MKQYSVTGMSCAACSARVEKAVLKVPGVTSCSVSLLTNSMGVEGDAKESDIVKDTVLRQNLPAKKKRMYREFRMGKKCSKTRKRQC